MIQTLQICQAWLLSKCDSDEGATMVEYGLMVALVAVIVALAAAALGTGIFGIFNDATTTVGGTPAQLP
jgi:pilus assembly protein Flp/PilA